jgi:hypothetical protein
VYFTDLEAADPAVLQLKRPVRHNGMLNRRDTVNIGSTKFLDHVWYRPVHGRGGLLAVLLPGAPRQTYTIGQVRRVVHAAQGRRHDPQRRRDDLGQDGRRSNRITLDCAGVQFRGR